MTEGNVRKFFGCISTLDFFEDGMTRPEAFYSTPKMMWTIRAERAAG